MSFVAANALVGPGHLTYGGETFFSKTPISAVLEPEFSPIETSATGRLEDRIVDNKWTVKFAPAGEWESLGVLHPFQSKGIGTKMRGAGGDSPLVIFFGGDVDQKLTLHNAIVTSPPSISFVAGETVFGECTITGLIKKDTAPDASGAYETLASQAYPGYADLDVSAILTPAVVASWGADPWDDIYSANGWSVGITPQLTPFKPADGYGTTDYIFDGVEVTVSGDISMTGTNLLAAITPERVAIGKGDTANKEDFNISATGLYFRAYNAVIEAGALRSGPEILTGQASWKGTRTQSVGALTAAYYLGTSAPI